MKEQDLSVPVRCIKLGIAHPLSRQVNVALGAQFFATFNAIKKAPMNPNPAEINVATMEI